MDKVYFKELYKLENKESLLDKLVVKLFKEYELSANDMCRLKKVDIDYTHKKIYIN